MKRRLYHPWWTHLPALMLLAALAVEFLRNRWIFAYRIPVHFNLRGEITRWGSGWEILLATAIPSLVLFAMSVLLDELWARQERRKSFNWLSLFDEALLGIQAGLIFSFLQQAFPGNTPGGMAGFNQLPAWPWLAGATAGAVAAAVMLELTRPYRQAPAALPHADTHLTEESVRGSLLAGQRWIYWESQNPRWIGPLALGLGLAFIAVGVVFWRFSPWLSLLYLALAPVFFILYGGLRVAVNSQRLEVRLGIAGVRLLRLPVRDIAAVAVHDFSPLRDFGGYGIRFNRRMTAFFFRGTRGVTVETVRGKTYLIGSDTPEQLATVIQAIRERPADSVAAS